MVLQQEIRGVIGRFYQPTTSLELGNDWYWNQPTTQQSTDNLLSLTPEQQAQFEKYMQQQMSEQQQVVEKQFQKQLQLQEVKQKQEQDMKALQFIGLLTEKCMNSCFQSSIPSLPMGSPSKHNIDYHYHFIKGNEFTEKQKQCIRQCTKKIIDTNQLSNQIFYSQIPEQMSSSKFY